MSSKQSKFCYSFLSGEIGHKTWCFNYVFPSFDLLILIYRKGLSLRILTRVGDMEEVMNKGIEIKDVSDGSD